MVSFLERLFRSRKDNVVNLVPTPNNVLPFRRPLQPKPSDPKNGTEEKQRLGDLDAQRAMRMALEQTKNDPYAAYVALVVLVKPMVAHYAVVVSDSALEAFDIGRDLRITGEDMVFVPSSLQPIAGSRVRKNGVRRQILVYELVALGARHIFQVGDSFTVIGNYSLAMLEVAERANGKSASYVACMRQEDTNTEVDDG